MLIINVVSEVCHTFLNTLQKALPIESGGPGGKTESVSEPKISIVLQTCLRQLPVLGKGSARSTCPKASYLHARSAVRYLALWFAPVPSAQRGR